MLSVQHPAEAKRQGQPVIELTFHMGASRFISATAKVKVANPAFHLSVADAGTELT
jgi:hypothetical protein